MNNQERLARQWAEDAKRAAPRHKYTDETHAAIEHILATTTPEPSMADVEWEDEKHVMAGATMDTENGPLDVVMLVHDASTLGYVTLDKEVGRKNRTHFTPNGKRYELREVTDEPEHPEVLATVEDYENSPEGTIVTLSEYDEPLRKNEQGMWADPNGYKFTNERMAGISRTVKLWGLVK